ncbi:hypothetical protein BDV11DRAFT_170542 [Aspergillus similis]
MPEEPEKTPMVCIAAGTGIAPFRGFLQERTALVKQGQNLAPVLLFFGCREPQKNDLYRAQLEEWQKLGVVDVWWDIVDMWKDGAKVFVCGSRGLADPVKGSILEISREEMARRESQGEDVGALGVDSAEKWMEAQRNVRNVMDVFD